MAKEEEKKCKEQEREAKKAECQNKAEERQKKVEEKAKGNPKEGVRVQHPGPNISGRKLTRNWTTTAGDIA